MFRFFHMGVECLIGLGLVLPCAYCNECFGDSQSYEYLPPHRKERLFTDYEGKSDPTPTETTTRPPKPTQPPKPISTCIPHLNPTHASYSSHPFDVTVLGAYNIYGSLSKQSVELIHVLRDDVSLSFIPSSKSDLNFLWLVSKPVQKVLVTPGLQNMGKVLLVEDRHYSIPKEGLFEHYGLPATDQDQIRFVYDMAETSRIGRGQVQGLNLYDAVLVPDSFLEEVFVSSGVTVPVFTLPLGMYMDDFLEAVMPPKPDSRPFTFGSFGWMQERKNQLLLVQAFHKAFGNNPDVRLWISPRGSFEEYEKQVKDEIERLGATNIILERRCDTRKQYIKKFEAIDCYVNISRGEGFSYQPREAMLFGIPVIITDNTAQHTICKSGLVRSVPSTVMTPYIVPEFGYEWQCSIDDVVEALQDVYENPSKYGTKEARSWAEHYDFVNLRSLYLSILSPKKVILGTKNEITPTHVETNSLCFYEKLKRVFPHACQ